MPDIAIDVGAWRDPVRESLIGTTHAVHVRHRDNQDPTRLHEASEQRQRFLEFFDVLDHARADQDVGALQCRLVDVGQVPCMNRTVVSPRFARCASHAWTMSGAHRCDDVEAQIGEKS